MRILLVNHTFPPVSYAGSESCVLSVAQELKRRGHDAAVFYRVNRPECEECELETGEFEGLPVFTINNTYRFARLFQDIYVNPALGARFAFLLRQWKPDVVHFHHLTNLSLTLPGEAKAYGAAVAMTLHDYWLHCQRGQLLKRDLRLCDGPSLEGCRSCLAPQLLRGNAQRFISTLLHPKGWRSDGGIGEELNLRRARIDTPDSRFVAMTRFDPGDGIVDTLLAHPPAALSFPFRYDRRMVFETAIGMHPATYDREGMGVCFEVECGGELVFSRCLNPKKNPEDRGWHSLQLNLPPSRGRNQRLVLRTRAELPGDNRYCTAGWRRPVLKYMEEPPSEARPDRERAMQIRALLYRAAECVADGVAAFSPRAAEGVLHRTNWSRRVLEEVDAFISPSRFLRDFFIQRGLPAGKIEYLDNGFEPADPWIVRPVRLPLRFGYMGTWIPSKGVDLVLRAFQAIDPTEARLAMYGFFPGYDGYDDYETYLRSLSSPAVEWCGRYASRDIDAVLAGLDVLIVPSIWWENSPLTIHEAFRAGVPVIAGDAGGMAELLGSGGGLLFRHRDADDLRRVVKRIIASPGIADDLRRSIPGVQSISGHVDRLETLYTELMEEKRR